MAKLKDCGKFWWDYRDNGDGTMTLGIECQHPPADKHFLLLFPGSDTDDLLDIAQEVVELLNSVQSKRAEAVFNAMINKDWVRWKTMAHISKDGHKTFCGSDIDFYRQYSRLRDGKEAYGDGTRLCKTCIKLEADSKK